MIRLLKGIIELQDGNSLLIDVNGVGYHVYASHGVLSGLPSVGDKIKVFTYTHVREDLLELYGFAALEDLKLFEQLLGVSGIGPKTAMGIFSAGTREKILQALISEDVTFFASVPRLGKKNAQKLIIELKNKIENTGNGILIAGKDENEVIEALKGFGFSQREAYDAVRSLSMDITDVSEKIRIALKYLGR